MSKKKSIPKLNFFKLHVTDLVVMEKFYRTAFGFLLEQRLEGEGFVELILAQEDNETKLVLLYQAAQQPLVIGNGHGPVGFMCEDARELYDRAIVAGGKEVTMLGMTGPTDMHGGCIAFLLDPEGHPVEIVQPSPTMHQNLGGPAE